MAPLCAVCMHVVRGARRYGAGGRLPLCGRKDVPRAVPAEIRVEHSPGVGTQRELKNVGTAHGLILPPGEIPLRSILRVSSITTLASACEECPYYAAIARCQKQGRIRIAQHAFDRPRPHCRGEAGQQFRWRQRLCLGNIMHSEEAPCVEKLRVAGLVRRFAVVFPTKLFNDPLAKPLHRAWMNERCGSVPVTRIQCGQERARGGFRSVVEVMKVHWPTYSHSLPGSPCRSSPTLRGQPDLYRANVADSSDWLRHSASDISQDSLGPWEWASGIWPSLLRTHPEHCTPDGRITVNLPHRQQRAHRVGQLVRGDVWV